MNQFLKHSDDECEFFLDLVIYERASDQSLKIRYKNKLDNIRTERLRIKKRMGDTNEINDANKAQFYTSHLYGLIHVLVSLPKFQTFDSLQRVLGISEVKLKNIINFLLKINIIKYENNKYSPLENNIHLDKNSPHILQHHTNWRLATVEQIKNTRKEDLHYSLSFSTSNKVAAKIRESILKQLETFSEEIVNSEPENTYAYCFDFFEWS